MYDNFSEDFISVFNENINEEYESSEDNKNPNYKNDKVHENEKLDNDIKMPQKETKTNVKTNVQTEVKLFPIERNEQKKLEKKDKIFNIIKPIKKKGRIANKFKKKFTGKHNKFTEDNIIRKIKASFIEKSRNYINHEYNLCMNKHKFKKIKKFLQRISPSEHRKISKEENIKWFKSKLKDIFSADLSTKCSLYNLDYNKEQIDEVYKNPEAENVVNILEKNVSEIYSLYSQDVEIKGFETLKDDLKVLKKKMEKKKEENIDEYLKKYEEIAKNLETIYQSKKSKTSKA